MYFGKNVRLLRRMQNVSQNELANHLGYRSFTTIQKWEDGTTMPGYPTISKVADFFHVDVEAIMNQDLGLTEKSEVPIIGTVRGGLPLFAETNITGYEHVYPDDARHADCFYLQVIGDSMKNARILPGDLLYVQRQDTLENGDIGVVLLDNEEATVKRILYKDGNMILQPENEDYQPIVLSAEDIFLRNVRIIGKVLHNRIKF